MSEHERQDGSSGVAAGERPEDEAERLAAMVRDPRNRVLGVFYANKADPRVIVPKSTMRPGWTINFGHRYATLFLLLTFVIVLGPGVAVLVFGVATPVTLALTVVLGIVAVAVFASYMSRVGL